jgi:membrane fusion protein, heavy metal efflux system
VKATRIISLDSFSSLSTLSLSLCVVALTLTGCGNQNSNPVAVEVAADAHVPVNTQLAQDLHIKTAMIEAVEMGSTLHVTGQIRPEFGKEVEVNTRLAGRVITTDVKPGDMVVAGQRLALVDSQQVGDIEAELIEAKAKLQMAKVQVDRERQIYEEQLRRPQTLINARTRFEEAKVQLELAEAEFKRQDGLYKEKIAAQKDYIISKGNLARAKSVMDQAASDLQREEGLFKNKAMIKGNLVLAQAEATRAKQHFNTLRQRLIFLGMTEPMIDAVVNSEHIEGTVPILAPANGMITHQDVFAGEMVDPGIKAFTITDLKKVAVSADIPEVDLPHVHHNGKINVRISSFPNETFTGTINYVSANVNPETRTVPIRAQLDNPHMRLKSNMFAEIDLKESPAKVLACPKSAIHERDGGFVAYVESSKGFEERKIKKGARSTEHTVEVVSGLSEGEKVVTEGSLLLKTELASHKH